MHLAIQNQVGKNCTSDRYGTCNRQQEKLRIAYENRMNMFPHSTTSVPYIIEEKGIKYSIE
jgi:hypothetical protein